MIADIFALSSPEFVSKRVQGTKKNGYSWKDSLFTMRELHEYVMQFKSSNGEKAYNSWKK